VFIKTEGPTSLHTHIQKIRTSLYSYWDVFSERFIDHFHMILVYNVLTQFSHNYWRKIDKLYSPNSDSGFAANTREWMEEPLPIKMERRELNASLKRLEHALGLLDDLNKKGRF